jgi:hypothetical protein
VPEQAPQWEAASIRVTPMMAVIVLTSQDRIGDAAPIAIGNQSDVEIWAEAVAEAARHEPEEITWTGFPDLDRLMRNYLEVIGK